MTIDTKRLATDAAYWDGAGVPDGATHYFHPSGDWYKKTEDSVFAWWPSIDRWHEAGRPERLNDERTIPRPQSEWVDGLPPVGCECEIIHPGIKNHGWQKAIIKAYFDDRVAVLSNKNIWADMNGYACIKIDEELQFRPIPTKAQRDRSELKQIIADSEKYGHDYIADAIIAAGWTKP